MKTLDRTTQAEAEAMSRVKALLADPDLSDAELRERVEKIMEPWVTRPRLTVVK